MTVTRIVTGLYQTNTYMIVGNGEAIVIDPGDDAECIIDQAHSRNAEIKYILLTHGHFDHIGAVADLKEHSAAEVYMSARDYELYLSQKDTREYAHVKPFEIDTEVSDGDSFELAGYKFTAISTPGHTPGGICYLLDDDIIFTGDTLFRLSIGRSDFAYGDGAELVRSVRKLFDLPNNRAVLPGHGKDTTLDFERKNNPYVRY